MIETEPGRGSSPLARGLHCLCTPPGLAPRIIPARAGFTRSCSWCSWASWDHPRSRGVYLIDTALSFYQIGSSPLARGLPIRDSMVTPPSGIIPARAGFTILGFLSSFPMADHPRSRGVYLMNALDAAKGGGSSPLARGLREQPCIHGHGRRIIPARAGFTVHL